MGINVVDPLMEVTCFVSVHKESPAFPSTMDPGVTLIGGLPTGGHETVAVVVGASVFLVG